MTLLSNTTAQTLAPGQSITFNSEVLHTGNAETYRMNTSSVKMKACGVYAITFNANVASDTALGVATLAIEVDGDVLADSIIKSTSTNATQLQNVGRTTAWVNHSCEYGRISVTNIGSSNVIVDTPSLFVRRLG